MSERIPEGWKVSPLSALASVSWGNTSLTKDSYVERGFPAFSAAGNDGIVANAEYNSVGIVLSAIGARCGRTFLTPSKWTAIKNTITILTDKQDIRFLYQVFNFNEVWNKSGGAQPFISLSDAKKTQILHPPLSEQKKIASILTSVDEVIEKTQSQINKLQDLKKATMNELLTKGIGHTDFKDSELGRIPKSWKITELSKVSMILSSNVDKKTIENETLVSLCNYMDVYKNLIITREINFMKASAKKSEINKFLIKKDDVIITKDSETPDDIAISSYVSEDFDNVLCGYHLSIIRSNKSVVDGKFLSLFFKLDYTRHRFSILANGTTRFGLNLKEIENSKILVPSLEEQKKIANIIFSLDDEISTITKKFNKYIFLKKSLMQDLLTGKVRVSVN